MDLRLASWNVRSLHRPGAIYQVSNECQRYKVGIAALQEVRWTGNGECCVDDKAVLFYSGNDTGKHEHGTGFMVQKNLMTSVVRFDAVSDRLCVLRVRSKFFNISIINVYAPTELADEETKNQFYDELETVYEQLPDYDVKLVLGDFNGKIGKEEAFMPTIGIHSKHDQTNDNGLRLISFATSKAMVVKSTMFPHKEIYKGTWKSPDGKTINQIDHVLVDERHKSIVKDVRSFRGADCDSDHYMVCIKIKARIKVSQHKVQTANADIIDTENLKNKDIQEKFSLEICNRFSSLDIEENVDTAWENIKKAVQEVALNVIGRKRRKKRRKWWNSKCEDAVNNRRNFKILAEQNPTWKDKFEETRVLAHKTIKNAKKTELYKIVRNLETLAKEHSTRNFFKEVNSFRKGYQPSAQILEDDDGNLITDPNDTVRAWRDYFKDLLNCPQIQAEVTIPPGEPEPNLEALSFDEVRSAILRLKNNKSPGIDNIPAELWKSGGAALQTKLYELIEKIWNIEQLPQEWNIGVICPVHKKGNKRRCTNYRGIALLPTAYKVLAYVLLKRLEPYAEKILGDYQCGFRRNRSTVDQIFLLRQLMEKRWEYAQSIHTLFVDFTKAYDSIDRDALYNILGSYNIPSKLIALIKVATTESRMRVKVGTRLSEEFNVVTGLKQGDALSPMLFNLVLEYIVRKVMLLDGGIEVNGKHKVIGYADDLALLGQTAEEVQQSAQVLEAEATKIGLKISHEKSEYLLMKRYKDHRANRQCLKVGSVSYKGVPKFKYLGCTITEDNTREDEIDIRIQNTLRCTAALHKVLVSKLLCRKAKFQIYKSIIRPILVYGCEAWTLTLKEENKLLVTERKVLRKILGPTLKNDGTWRARKNQELEDLFQEPNIMGEIKSHRLRWLGHIERMEEDRGVKRAYLGRPTGRRPVGRPRYRWKDRVEQDLSEILVNGDWREIAKERGKWRHLLSEAKTHFGSLSHRSK